MRAVVVVLALCGVASADVPRVGVFGGLGVRSATGYENIIDADPANAIAFDVMVGVHVSPELALGLRVGASHHTGEVNETGHSSSDWYAYSAFTFGLAYRR